MHISKREKFPKSTNPLTRRGQALENGNSIRFIRESPITAAQHIVFFVIFTWEWLHSISTNFGMQCVWRGAKNANDITWKYSGNADALTNMSKRNKRRMKNPVVSPRALVINLLYCLNYSSNQFTFLMRNTKNMIFIYLLENVER